MATWEDGPEYAPLQRPDNFSEPSADPLEIVPVAAQSAALAPKDRPHFDSPSAPVAPLSTLVPVVPNERDPDLPFEVAASTLTSADSAWGSAHWSPPVGESPVAGQLVAGLPVGQPPGAHPSGAQPPYPTGWPPPENAFPPVTGPAQLPGGYPPPGTPQWFGPGPASPQLPQPPAVLDAKAVFTAATPGLLIVLALSVIYPLAPILFGVAFVLSSRVTVAQQQIRQAFFLGLGFLGFFAVAGLASWNGWWQFVSVSAFVICWAMLVTVLVLVYRALQRRTPQSPRYPSNWG